MQSVAPLVGAWIETEDIDGSAARPESHPSWVRGLKRLIFLTRNVVNLSHPSWVRGLKPIKTENASILDGRTPRGCVD